MWRKNDNIAMNTARIKALEERVAAMEEEVTRPRRVYWHSLGVQLTAPSANDWNMREIVDALYDKFWPKCEHCGKRDCDRDTA